jgi:hypothetical protein
MMSATRRSPGDDQTVLDQLERGHTVQQPTGLPEAFQRRLTLDLHQPGALDELFRIHRATFGGMTMEETEEERQAREERERQDRDSGRTFTQAELTAKAAEEKHQGERKAARKIMETLGFDTIEEAERFVKDKREADEKSKTEAQRREDELKERERKAEEREAKAVERERIANHRSALVEAGARGDDLNDALRLFSVDDDASEADIAAAATALKERRPELFAASATTESRTRGHLPGGKPGARKAPDGVKPGAAGREYAKKRGWIKDTTD